MLCGEGPLEEADKQEDVCHITETAEHPEVDVWMAPSIIRCISLAMVWGMPCPRLVCHHPYYRQPSHLHLLYVQQLTRIPHEARAKG